MLAATALSAAGNTAAGGCCWRLRGAGAETTDAGRVNGA